METGRKRWVQGLRCLALCRVLYFGCKLRTHKIRVRRRLSVTVVRPIKWWLLPNREPPIFLRVFQSPLHLLSRFKCFDFLLFFFKTSPCPNTPKFRTVNKPTVASPNLHSCWVYHSNWCRYRVSHSWWCVCVLRWSLEMGRCSRLPHKFRWYYFINLFDLANSTPTNTNNP